ncbi:MAG: HIT domain-containing protein [Candidatus Colwellbacteria bacterium]|nr:HIT domain-containing protein [Candidatus Colwellbacteria bacterium]
MIREILRARTSLNACPFCSVDENRQRVLVERKRVYIMPSNPMLVPHHLLVIPKRHVELPSELAPEERHELFETVIEFQEKIRATSRGMGCDVRQDCRPFLPQSDYKVDHVHYHLLQRQFGDELYQKTQIFEKDIFDKNRLSKREMTQEIEALKSLLSLA